MKKKRHPKRDWSDALPKVHGEKRCRGCGTSARDLARSGRRLTVAHLIGRTFDEKEADGVLYVHPDSVVGLCGPVADSSSCHYRFDHHELDLWPVLNPAERLWCSQRIGEGQARRRISGRDWAADGVHGP